MLLANHYYLFFKLGLYHFSRHNLIFQCFCFLYCYARPNDFIHSLPLILVRVTGGLEPIPATIGLDRSPVCRRANTQRQTTIPTHIHTYGQNRVNLNPLTVCLERTFSLGGNSANQRPTITVLISASYCCRE